MIKFRAMVKRELDFQVMASKINEMTRVALTSIGMLWISDFLPLHFLPSAVQRYGYTARSRRTLARKYKKNGSTAPLVDTGKFRDSVLHKSPLDFNIVARATTNKQTVKVKVPVPHPLNPKNAGEIRQSVNAEWKAMSNEGKAAFMLELDKLKLQRTNTNIGS